MRQIILSLVLLMGWTLVQAASVVGVRMWPAPDNTRVVFDLNAPIEHNLFVLQNPERIVIDLKNTSLKASFPALTNASFIKQIRYARRDGDDLRVVLDLKRDVKAKSFALKPQGEYGNRLVVDLIDESQDKPRQPVRDDREQSDHPRDVIIAIDPGHGGEDPGAIGKYGTREKDVTLAIARKLKTLIDRQTGMKAMMTRNGDYYVALGKRVEKAREARADLFISIHADSFRNRHASGSSVFMLSEHGASSEVARFLAKSENNSDLIGGVSLDDKGDLLKKVLVDMVKNSTMDDSHDLARDMLNGLRRVTRLHRDRVEQAGFRVLKSPDIPSVLIETAFISNPKEERKLRSPRVQANIAHAIFTGLGNYFKDNPPPGTLLALKDRRHRVVKGDTLSELADQYQIPVASLRKANRMKKGDLLQVGDILLIPVQPYNS